MAIIWLRSDAALGLLAVVFLIVVIVAADTGAFLSGRLLGGPKLWPRVSPNKTWAGLIGALVASAVVGACFWFAVPGASPLRLARNGRGAGLCLAGRRPGGVGPQAPFRRQGHQAI